MKKYLYQSVDPDNFNVVSVIDELPLWSAPFGLDLLNTITLKRNIRVLDVGCGSGFPILEIAQRLGSSSTVYGIDPWKTALERVRLKKHVGDIGNAEVIHGHAEFMPFENDCFDLIVSNNGINNVRDIQNSLNECYRVSKSDAQMIMTYNLENSMIEFYTVFQEILETRDMRDAVLKMKAHIHQKRRPLDEMKNMLENSGFRIKNIMNHAFQLRFMDGTSFFNHSFIKNWFIDSWKSILADSELNPIFQTMEYRLNEIAEQAGELVLTIPFVTIDARCHLKSEE